MSSLEQRLEFLRNLAWEGGELSLKGHGNCEAIEKASADGFDMVTEYDHRVEELVHTRIEREFDEPVLGEEFGLVGDVAAARERLWVVDPIDGTFNYGHGLPLYGVILAYCEKRVPVAGVICLPAVGELFSAAAGQGAWIERRPAGEPRRISVRDETEPSRMVFTVEGHFTPEVVNAYFQEGLPRRSLRTLMCAAAPLAYIPAGRMDAFVQTSLNVWDCAAGDVILREAGGPACVDETGENLFPKYLDRRLSGAGTEKFILVAASTVTVRELCLRLLVRAGVAPTS